MFATHLHELVEIEYIANDPALCVCHMHVDIDTNGKITYDRHLRNGAGSTLYGLEVCQSLGMPPSFVKMAHDVRRGFMNQSVNLVKPKWSHYNKSVCVDTCKVCNAREATDVHHIQYQHTASNDGFIKNGVRVHDSCNLVPLCKHCHMDEHHGTLRIFGYRDTSSGSELHFEKLTEQQSQCHPTLDHVLIAFHKKYKYNNAQWYMRTVKGWRKCKEESLIKEARKSYKYTVSDEDMEQFKRTLGADPCS